MSQKTLQLISVLLETLLIQMSLKLKKVIVLWFSNWCYT